MSLYGIIENTVNANAIGHPGEKWFCESATVCLYLPYSQLLVPEDPWIIPSVKSL